MWGIFATCDQGLHGRSQQRTYHERSHHLNMSMTADVGQRSSIQTPSTYVREAPACVPCTIWPILPCFLLRHELWGWHNVGSSKFHLHPKLSEKRRTLWPVENHAESVLGHLTSSYPAKKDSGVPPLVDQNPPLADTVISIIIGTPAAGTSVVKSHFWGPHFPTLTAPAASTDLEKGIHWFW